MTRTESMTCGVLAAALVLGTAGVSDAQSLGEVARREAVRRGEVSAKGKVYSNTDLTPDFTTPEPPPAPAAEAKPESQAEPQPAAEALERSPVGDDEMPPPKNERGEEYWRQRATRIRERLETQRSRIAALQGRVDSMSGLEGGTAARERELTARRLREAQGDLVSLEEEWTNFEAAARAKDVPPAWLQ